MRPSRLRLGLFVVFSVVGGVARAVADENQVQSGDYMPVVQAIARIRQQTEDVKAHNFQAMTARADHWEGAGAEAFRAQLQSGRLKQNSDRLIGDVRDNIIGNLQKRDPNSLVSVKEVENYGPAFNTYTKAIRDALWGEAQDAGLKRADFPNDRAFQRAVQAKLGADDWKEVIAKIEPVHKQILADMTDPKGDPKLPGPVRMMDTNIQTQLGANLKDSEHGGGTEVKHPPTDTPPGTGTGTGAVTPNGPAGPTQDAGNHLAFGDVGGANAVLAGAAASGSADAQGYALMGGMAYDEGRYSDAASAARSALQLDPKNTEANTVLHFSEGRVDGAGGGGPASKDGAASSGERGIAGGGAASGGRATFGGFVGSGASLAPTDAQRGAAARLSAEQAQKAAANAIGLHDLTGAMAFIERGLALNPKDPALLHLRGTVYAKQHDYQKALADEKSALELDPRNPEILKAMGLDQLRGGMYKDALASANAYIEAHPNEAYGYALRAQAYARLGDHESYLADMRRAAELDPFYQEASAHPSNIQNPTDADLLFLFPGEEGPKTAAQPAGRARQFSWVVGASILGGLLMAIGLLQTVLAPLKEQVSSVFTRITRTGPTLGALDNDALADASPTGLIRGQYEITRPIGAGGMGMVYEGTDRSLGRRVAIKKMRDELRADPRERARFVSEAKTVAALHHPNIVDIFAIADDASDVYLIFEFVDGKTVHDLVQTAGKLTPEQTAAIVAASADALDYAHSKGVIHRDLKPESINIGDHGEVLVMDWGLAAVLNPSGTGTSTSTPQALPGDACPQYLAPEQARGELASLDVRTDIYALGAILYHVLSLRSPVSADDPATALKLIAEGRTDHLDVGQRYPHLPRERVPDPLAAIVAKAMSFQPSGRYQRVEELQADLAAYQNATITEAEKVGPVRQFIFVVRRYKTVSLAAAIVVGTSLFFGTTAVIAALRARKESAIDRAVVTNLRSKAAEFLRLAEHEADTQRFENALTSIDASLAVDPTPSRPYWERAWALLALERWDEAAAALRTAQEHGLSGPETARALAAVTKMKAISKDPQRWKNEAAHDLFRYLETSGATGPAFAIATKLKENAEARRKLVDQRLLGLLGKDRYSVTASSDGQVALSLAGQPLRSLDVLRGLPVDSLDASGTAIVDLEALRGLRLQALNVSNTKISNLSALQGMPLRKLILDNTQARDLAPLKGMPLETLSLKGTKVYDFTLVKGMPVRALNLENTVMTNLSALQGVPLESLNLAATFVSDLSPLQGAPLKELDLRRCKKLTDFRPVLTFTNLERLSCDVLPKELAPLRQSKTLQTIEADAFPGEGYQGARPAANFWADFDAKAPAGAR